MKKYALLFLAFCFVSLSGFSQVSEAFSSRYLKAVGYLSEENYQDALPIFMYLDTLTPENPNVSFNIGVCYVNSTYDKAKAIPYLDNAIKNIALDYEGVPEDISAPPFAFYFLGRAYHVIDSINKAIEYFEKFKYYLTENDAELLKDANRQIEMCYNAKKLMANPVNIKIENLGEPVNSSFPDYSPSLSLDGSTIIFTSRREGSTGGKKDTDGKYFEDIYIAYYNSTKDKWENMRKIGASINSSGHEASISQSLDGKELFIYKDDNGDGNVYLSYFKNDDWSAPVKLSTEINSKGWETHACLSPDGNTLYFISNRSGGFGGLDLWQSEKLANGNWSEAVNLGSKINTEYDEESPYMLADGVTLYFSSKGHESMGGFDIFIATQSDDGYWSSPENIGYPINTTDDDVFYVPTQDEKHAYYSSAKEGGFGDQDIYKLSIIAPKKLLAQLKGIIFDEYSYKPVAAKLEIIDSKTGDIIANFTSDDINGDYYVTLPTGKTYEMTVTADKYVTYKETFTVPDTITDPEINKAIIMKKLIIASTNNNTNTTTTKDEKIMFGDREIVVGERIVLENVLFDFDKYTLRSESTVELDKWVEFLTKNSTLKIEISGHTDNKGTAEYNNTLSDNRAKVVCEYFISKGISKDRMKSKGYGFDLPIASNKTDEGRQKNRRTEIKITSRY